MKTTRMMIALVAVFALLAVGCNRMKKVAERTTETTELKQIGLLYKNYVDTNNKAPANPDDLRQVAGRDLRLLQVVRDIKAGKYIVQWNAIVFRDKTKAASAVLGYEKDAPTDGGMVLMGDGSVKKMTAAEFQSAPKANDK